MANVNGKTGIRCRCHCVDIFQGTIAQGREVERQGENKWKCPDHCSVRETAASQPEYQPNSVSLSLASQVIPCHPVGLPFVLYTFLCCLNLTSALSTCPILVLFYIAIPYLPPLILHISQSHPAARHILNIKYDFQTLSWRKKKNDFELNFMSQQLRP